MDFGFLITLVAWLGVVTMRIGVALLVMPMFGPSVVTGAARGMMVLILALIPVGVAPLNEFTLNTPITMIVLLAREAFIGLLLGFLFGLPIWVIQNVGSLIDLMTGSSNAAVFDPLTGHSGGPLGNALHFLFIALFMAMGGFTLIAEALYDSYRIWPIGTTFPDIDGLFKTFWVEKSASMFVATVQMVAPIAVALLMVDFTLGLVNRFAPNFNVFEISPAIKGGVAMLMLYLVFAFFAEQLLSSIKGTISMPSMFEALRSP
jgi:type III secretion protein T